MEQIIKVGEKNFILGLQWHQIQGKDPLLAARAKARSSKLQHGVVRSIDVGDGVVTYQSGMVSKKNKGIFYAAAAHLSDIHPSVIGVERLEDDLFWICVADNGRVMPGYDSVASDSEVKMLFSELASEYELDFMVMVMDSSVADILGVSNYINKRPLQVLSEKEPDDSIKIRNIAGVSNSIYLGAAIAVAVMGFGGYSLYSKIQADKELQRMIDLQNADQAERDRLALLNKGDSEAEILRKAKEEEISWLKDEISQLGVYSSITQMMKVNSRLPRNYMGWELSDLIYSSEKRGEAISIWNRDTGMASSLKALFANGAGSVSFSADLSSARVTHKLDIGTIDISDVIKYIEDHGTNHQDFTDLLNATGVTYAPSILDTINRKKPIDGIEDPVLKKEAQLSLRKRSFIMTGKGDEELSLVMYRVNAIKNFAVKEIKFSNSDGITYWEVVGELNEI